MNLYADFTGLARTMYYLGNLQVVYQLFSNQVQEQTANYLFQKIKENASATCHSLKDFRYKGADDKWHYMYSVLNPMNPHPEKPYLVHKHTGQLLSSLSMEKGRQGGKWYVAFGFDRSKCPYTQHVIYGTGKMIPRNFIKETVEREVPKTVRPKIRRDLQWLHGMVVNLYTLARITKWMSKFYGTTQTTNTLFKAARSARNFEVFASGSFPIYGSRLYNTMVGGKIASKFMLRGGGIPSGINRLGNATINREIAKNITSKYVFLRPTRFR